MGENKKKFVIPEVEIIDFSNDDIITVSGESFFDGDAYDEGAGGNKEGW